MVHMTTVVKTGTQPSKTKPPTEWECPYCKHDKDIAPNKGTPENFKEMLMAMRDSVPEFNSDVAVTGITDKTIADNVKQYTYHQKNPDIVHNSKTGKWRGHGQKDIHDYGDTQDEKKAVMAVSSPEQGKTCNCNQGDHSNANGDQHGMYNQEGGRANWQGQGLPQPSKTCECDEKPAEADKVPNADARISDKEMKKPKKKGGFQLNYDNLNEEIEAAKKKKKKPKNKGDVGHDTNMEEKLARLGRGGKGTGTAAKRTRRRQERLARQDKAKKTLYISDLDDEGKPRKMGRTAAASHAQRMRHKRPAKKIQEAMAMFDKKLKALEEIIKKRRTRRGSKRGKKGTIAGHTGKWRKTLTPLSGRGESTTPKDNAATAYNREVAAKLGFLKPEPEKKINPKALGKPAKTASPTGVKQFRKPKRRGGANTTGAITAEQGAADAANTKRQKLEAEKKRKEPTKKKTPPKKRTGTKVREGMSMFDKALFLAKHRGKKKITAAEKEKKKLEAKLSPEVEANMKRVDDLKDNVDALGRDKRTQHSSSGLQHMTAQRAKLQRELLANEKKQKEEAKKKKIVKPKVKPKKSKFPKFGIKAHGKKFDWESFFRKYGIKPPEKKEKAEENTHGAWGQRGLGDGNGTGAIQGAGDTHLITPVKQKELDKLMAGARYMPRSVPRKKK